MVDRLDQGVISPQVVQQSYQDLYKLVAKALFRTHVEGQLKVHRPVRPRVFLAGASLVPCIRAVLLLRISKDFQFPSSFMYYGLPVKSLCTTAAAANRR